MAEFDQFHDGVTEDIIAPRKLPDMLNVLSILTFIGCAIGVLSALYSYFMTCNQVDAMNQLSDLSESGPMSGFMNAAISTVQKQCEQRLPLLLVSLAGTLFCFIGVLQMRKFKKTGFYLYLTGELAAPVITIFILGGALGALMIAGLIFPLVFIILYATQLKHLR